jgi:mono/diheme cytochrome c family protein
MRTRIARTCGNLLLCLTVILMGAPLVRAQGDAETNYKMKCAACHGPDGVGATPAGKALSIHDFHSPDVAKETDAQLTDIITNGKNKMPKYGDKLKPQEIKDLVAYVRGLAKK